MKVINEEVVLKIIALTIGTTEKGDTENHHLDYLLKKLYGLDGLSLDEENTKIYDKLVKIKESYKNGNRMWKMYKSILFG